MSSVPDTDELRRAGLSALGWSALLWLPAGLLVAVGVVATGRIGSGYPEAVLGFIVDEAGVGYCFVIMAIACGVGYPIAQARRPVLPSGLVESQIFAVIVYAAMLVVSLPLQAILLDGHFVVEQAARSRSGRPFKFNGTAGVWRRKAIEAAGGWSADTLTEDLDLSVRAQLASFRFVFLEDVSAAGELPEDLAAYRSQQTR